MTIGQHNVWTTFAILATIRLATVLYALALALSMWRRDRASRIFWTLGCAFYLAHVAAAFAFRHHWSHTAAYDETARQTRALFHLDWGGGIYFNYIFSLLWIADAAWWWIAGLLRYRARPRALSIAVQIFFAFMFVNGAIVFGSPVSRAIGTALLFMLLAILAFRSSRHRARSSPIPAR